MAEVNHVIRMPRSLHDAVKEKAAEQGISMAEAMRRAFAAYIGGPGGDSHG